MRFLVFGAGAIGTYIGGSLSLGGQQVVFIDRSETAKAISLAGMRLNLYGKQFELAEPVILDSISQALDSGSFDAGIFALKSFDTLSALEAIHPYRNELPPILCLQNGVDNELNIGAEIGNQRVIAGTVTSAIGRLNTGEIVLERLRGVGIAQTHPLSEELVKAFNTSGLNAHLFRSSQGMKWSKLVTNLLANASSAILSMTPAEIFAHTGLFRLEAAQIREALLVMKGLKYEIVDLPGTPVRLLAFAIQRLPLWASRPLLARAVGKGRGGKMPSFYIDLYSGRGKSEVEYLNGAIVAYGKKLNLPTPANQLLTDTLSGLTNGEIPIERFAHQPDRLLALWHGQ
jgi:2-dehydropantoate 2-reductase